jgi:FliI/YscN family ATPase
VNPLLIDAQHLSGMFSRWSQSGKVVGFNNGLIRAVLPIPVMGEVYQVMKRDRQRIPARVASTVGSEVLLSPLGKMEGVFVGATVEGGSANVTVRVPEDPLGAVLGSLGESIQGARVRQKEVSLEVFASPVSPFDRRPLDQRMSVGVRSIDALCTLARGQRVGLFAEAGVGKTTLLGMMGRWADADAIVIALVGERGREVSEFIQDVLGEQGLKRAVVVVATSDESSSRRLLAPYTATAIAEYLRDKGKDVLLLCDSLTRMARAYRELHLSLGELPVHRGYPVSLFSELPCLLERGGRSGKGSITAIYTVLTESERIDSDPLADELKSLLDGHIVLSRKVAQAGVHPALYVGNSLSRLFHRLASPEQIAAARIFRRVHQRLEEDRDIELLGGTMDAEYLELKARSRAITDFLHQDASLRVSADDAIESLIALTDGLD